MGLLIEGRLDTVFNKYRKKIEKERKLTSPFSNTSWFDKLSENHHFEDTNYKYLDDVLSVLQKQFVITDDEDYTPLTYDSAREYVVLMNDVTDRLGEAISYYDLNKDRFEIREIRNYQTVYDFMDDVNEKINTLTKKEEKKIQKSGSVDVFSNDDVTVVKPITYEASCYYGAGTKWCTASRDTSNHWLNYSKKGNLYYVFLNRYKSDNRFYKVAIQTFFDSDFNSSIYWDATDEPMTKKEEQLFKMVLPEEAKQAIISDFNKTRPKPFDPIINNLKADQTTTMDVLAYIQYDLGESKDTIFVKIPPFDVDMDDAGANSFGASTRMYLTSKKFGDLQYEDILVLFYEPGVGQKEVTADINFDVGDNISPQTDGVDLFEGLTHTTQGIFKISNISSEIRNKIIKMFISGYMNSPNSNLRRWVDKTYPDRRKAYTMAGYTFTRGGDLTKRFLKYLRDLGENNPVTRKKVLMDMGVVKQTNDGWVNSNGDKISLEGYLSSFFSAMKQADIIQGTGKNFTVGPNFEKFAKKYNI
jgi:hypothetical protein